MKQNASDVCLRSCKLHTASQLASKVFSSNLCYLMLHDYQQACGSMLLRTEQCTHAIIVA